MTRTDVMASSRPRTAVARLSSKSGLRRLLIVPVALLLALALVGPTTAFAAEPNASGYNQEPNKPSTGTLPAKESGKPTSTPKSEPAPETTSTTPTTTDKASTLPFTGFDLRWSLGLGLVLMGAGVSIVVVQRRQRRLGGR